MPIVLKWPVDQSEAYVIIVVYVRAHIFIKIVEFVRLWHGYCIIYM